jgi:hypothetical protein
MLAGIGPVCAHQSGAGLAAPAGFYSPTRLSSAKDFTESWNGSRWSRTPVPNKGLAGGFFGVSCASASTCAAAGGYTTTVGQGQRLVIAWTVAL